MKKIIVTSWLVTLALFSIPQLTEAQTNSSFPVAVTLPVSGVTSGSGQVVVYQERTDVYDVSRSRGDPNAFGVTVERPPVLFLTATNTTPVITSGAVYMLVNNSTGKVERGDLLVTSDEAGIAAKALPEDENVFAVALEDAADAGISTILVHFDDQEARTLREERQEKEKAAELAALGIGGDGSGGGDGEVESGKSIIRQIIDDYARATIAALIAVGSLFFVMYTFRSTIGNATLAVGRNPRARNAIMTVSIGNIVFALVICLVAIFIAIAVLVLPIE